MRITNLMRAPRVSMRWWLAVTFALVSSMTALVVANVFTGRAEDAFRARAQELASGATVAAAEFIRQDISSGLAASTRGAATSHHLSLYVFDASGDPLTASRSRGRALQTVDARSVAVHDALQGRRFVRSFDQGRTIVIGLPLHAGTGRALLAVASRPELRAELGVVHDQVFRAVAVAIAVGAIAGLVISLLIAVRLRRIGRAASGIERGDFSVTLPAGFRDEVGDLAQSIDAMRNRLRDSFSELEDERDQLRRLLERLHQGVVVVDPAGRVEFSNRAAARMFGTSLAEGDRIPAHWAGLSLHEIVSGLLAPGAEAAEARAPKDEQHSYALVGLPPAPGSSTVILVLTNVTEHERRERVEREFVANAAHELRTPLTAIGTAVDALNAGAKDDLVERERFLGIVERQTARLGRLARALLLLARAQSREQAVTLEPVALKPLLVEVAQNVRPQQGVSIHVECPDDLAALGQRDLVEQVISNLAGNAAKYTDSGRITLAAEGLPEHAVMLAVSDTGPGIDGTVEERIFERFFVADDGKRNGFGLGLAIVRESVRALGGVMEIESRPGGGTRVQVTLAEPGEG